MDASLHFLLAKGRDLVRTFVGECSKGLQRYTTSRIIVNIEIKTNSVDNDAN
jgi:hypothetical protein